MTAQMSDYFKIDNTDYAIVALSVTLQFNPTDYGLQPHVSSTACWRGYWCDYGIENNKFVLKNLYLYNANGEYPDINGISISEMEYIDAFLCSPEHPDGIIVKSPKYFGHRLYKNIDLEIPYTGKILVGDGFLDEYYVHMGFQNGWAFETLLELTFLDGKLIKKTDCSYVAEQMRLRLDQIMDDENKTEIDFFVDNFSLDYKDKAWWIESAMDTE